MVYCKNCGAQLQEGKRFCGACGQPVEPPAAAPQRQWQNQPQEQWQNQPAPQPQNQQGLQHAIDSIMNVMKNTTDVTGSIDPADIEKNKAMGGLAYFIFFLPLIACPESKYGRFHANQGLIYLIFSIACGIAMSIVSVIFLSITWRLYWISSLFSFIIWLAILAVGIVGLINGFSGKARELPFIGKIRIIK